MGRWDLKGLQVIGTETLRNPIVRGAVVFGALRLCAPGTVTTEQALSAGVTVCCASSFICGLETIGGGLASIGQSLDGVGAGCRALGTNGLTVRRVALPAPALASTAVTHGCLLHSYRRLCLRSA